MMMRAFEAVLGRVSEVNVRVACTRARVRQVSIQSIRMLEARIVAALNGERLRGMPNLMRNGSVPFHAMRVNSWSRNGSGGHLPKDGREVLVFASDGRLHVASVRVEGGCGSKCVQRRDVTDEELVSEDLESFARGVQESLEKHMALSDRRLVDLERMESLARRLVDAIGLKIW